MSKQTHPQPEQMGGPSKSALSGPAPPKRKSRSTRGLQNKVNALEEQMGHVKANLENVVSLLLRLAPSAGLVAPVVPKTSSLDAAAPGVTAPPDSVAISPLEQWVQQLSNDGPSSLVHPIPPHPNHTQSLLGDLGAIEEGSEADGSTTEDDKELPEGEGEVEGLSMMREMLRREERRRLRADGHLTISDDPVSPKNRSTVGGQAGTDLMGHDDAQGLTKKRKRSHHQNNERSDVSTPSVKSMDPMVKGICSELHGKQLFDLFFKGAHAFIPVYDPSTDTWESLRRRSPFSISAILFVGQKIVDAGHEPSELQKQLKDHAEKIGNTTLFSPIANAEALQAMIVLASWGDTGWRPGSHAVSMAFDMDLYKCLPKLAEREHTSSTAMISSNEETERRLVVGARLWLLVCKMALEMAYNHGRPLIIDEGLILPHSHALLNHPSRLPTDGRIIASCELHLQMPLHRMNLSNDKRYIDQALQRYNDGASSWEAKWREYYIQQGIPPDHVLVTDLTTQRCFGSILTNSCLLREIRSPHDVGNLPLHRKKWLLSSLDDAQFIAGRILASEKDKLLYANHYSHVALASVSRIYIRLATLFPAAVDLRRVAKDLTQLTDVLSHFPGFSFARQLRYVITKARKGRILPPETRPGSPKPGLGPEGSFNPYLETDPRYPTRLPVDGHIILERGPELHGDNLINESPSEFDPFIAEQMFNQSLFGNMTDHGQGQSHDNMFNFDLDTGWNGPVNDGAFREYSSSSETNQAQTQWSGGSGAASAAGGNSNILSWLDFPALDLDQFGIWNGN
uniref:Transcription factor domain-containing protein n=1 Tax=Kwoniella bestiolae CBS 10118 TaxID=1296100 RepID=A0A1B9GDD6_9TREE|nr:hypothetical protein I302_00527 [Kwoniella bestiolae CBS 10118]OCF29036.1 hypothetical protein I302_00527 [Kwoniella bestiolae CBS 10118]